MGSDDIVNFEVIENSKENIQAIPSGRSARALAQLYTPPLGAKPGHAPSPLQTQDAHSAKRLEFEKEVMNIDDSDDPLDVYDRYVKWTLEAYPSAQNDKQSQLGPLLERATKAFQSSTHYKNDPRYLKLWLHYIRLFADAPQEIFRFLARHNIGDGLALYYEEYAAWLEGAGRFSQAEEIYSMGIEKEARPTERLIRKYGEFQHRFESRPTDVPEPSSPALPAVRPALAAKLDPFAPASPEPQAQSQPKAAKPKSGKPKMAIFSDEGEPAKASSSDSGPGWDSIVTIADRKKENTQEARPWAGETLKGGKTNKGAGKMMIFKDETKSHLHDETSKPHPLREQLQAVNPKTGRVEVVFVDLEQVYPNHSDPMSVEFSFEELRARYRGWLDRDWGAIRREEQRQARKLAEKAAAVQMAEPQPAPLAPGQELLLGKKKPLVAKPAPLAPKQEPLTTRLEPLAPKQDVQKPPKPQTVPLKGGEDDAAGDDENRPPSQAEMEKAKAARKARKEERANRTRKIQVMDVKEISGETQTIQAKLDSPSKKSKVRRKKGGREATMTLHTKEAMDDIYEIFNQPLKKPEEETHEPQSDEVSSDDDESDYTSGAESTATRSEFGDETTVGGDFTLGTVIGDNDSDNESGSGSDVDNTEIDRTELDNTTASAWSDRTESRDVEDDDEEEEEEEDNNDTIRTTIPYDGSDNSEDESFEEVTHRFVKSGEQYHPEVTTPTSPQAPASLPTRYVPVPPEEHNYPMRPYRDPAQAANNRLPFMTPIVEKTESSLGFATAYAQKEQLNAKTPSRSKGDLIIFEDGDEDEPGSGPFHDLLGQAIDGPGKITKLSLRQSDPKPSELLAEAVEEPARQALSVKPVVFRDPKPTGPIVQDLLCNPVADDTRKTILDQIQPPLYSYDGYFADTEALSGKALEIQKYTKAVKKMKNNAQDKTITNLSAPPKLIFDGSRRSYTVKKELGKGAFAPVYLIESTPKDERESAPVQIGKGESDLQRRSLEALKMEDPPTPWEFYIIRQAKRRLGVSRASDSIVHAYEMHVFQDECYLIEEFRDQGTLLDLVNICRADSQLMDEQLVMFFTIELFRTMEALHGKGIIHGDLKADNVLVRFDALQKGEEWDSAYQRDGRDGWASKGVSLIDFGRGIDMKAFKPDVKFMAEWDLTENDCAEMHEARPWTYQIDYHGLAGIIHTMLFGKYIATIAEKGAGLGAGATKTYKIKESLKRYWQTEIWHDCFDILLNPLMHLEGEEAGRLPVLKGMRDVREKMESYLESNCEKGIGLKSMVAKMEVSVKKR